jgi:pyruvate kinase
MRLKVPADEPQAVPCGKGAARLKQLIRELSTVRADMLRLESEDDVGLRETYRDSARNLLHYLALRRRDLRQAQQQLAALGLSSLGRSESHVMQNLEAVLGVLHRLAGFDGRTPNPSRSSVSLAEGQRLLGEHTRTLLGRVPGRRRVRIMVTMPSKAADDYDLVRDLLAHGMDCMRINCAHDDPAAWSRMIDNLRRAMKGTRRGCRVLMDLPGPNPRTGPMEPGPRVVSWSPHCDPLGRTEAPVRVWLKSAGADVVPPEGADVCLPVAGDWLANVRRGDLINFVDARGASRSLKIVGVFGEGRLAESNQTAYVATGTTLHLAGPPAKGCGRGEGKVGDLPPVEQWIRLRGGDLLTLRLDRRPGSPAVYDREGRLVKAASVGVTMPGAFAHVREGESVWFDDGKIGGRVTSVGTDGVEVEITHAGPGGEKLRGDKGINLPESRLRLPPLTEADLEALPFIARHADLVGYSFVRSASGVRALQRRLARLGGTGVGLVLKIETRRALRELPNIILAAMHSPAVGVMIARGDLAVECGYERLAEVQEELLWVCEAAHVPVIWATQVLESLAKKGTPSRAEVTDAAMGARAECVMLNKGPYVIEAVRALNDILRRMQSHQRKKRPMLRPLKLADHFAADEPSRDESPKPAGKRRAATGRVRPVRRS